MANLLSLSVLFTYYFQVRNRVVGLGSGCGFSGWSSPAARSAGERGSARSRPARSRHPAAARRRRGTGSAQGWPGTGPARTATVGDGRVPGNREGDRMAPDDLTLAAGARLLHIGPHKTGTTAIQGAFYLARGRLAAHGVV